MTTEHPDIALALRARTGDGAAWREIYGATRQRLFGLLAYQTGSRDEALDILQDTYLVALRSIDRYRAAGSLESWLVGIAMRRACDWKRRFLPRLKRSRSLEDLPSGQEGTSRPYLEEGRHLRQALSRLSDRQRSAVLLHEWFGYSYREVGESMGINEATARVHCFRGREILRELLSPAESNEVPARIQELR